MKTRRLEQKIDWARRRLDASKAAENGTEAEYYAAILNDLEARKDRL